MDLLEHSELLFDLAAGTTTTPLSNPYRSLTKVQKPNRGTTTDPASDLTVVYSDSPAAGEIGFVAPSALYFGTATAGGDEYIVSGRLQGDIPQGQQ